MIKKILTISFCLCTASFAWAQQSIDVESSRSLPFLEINPDVRTAGMGDANMGNTKSMYLYTNPSDAAEFTVGVGAEYDFMNMLAVRAGYHIGDKNNYVTAGLGFKYDYVGIDAAYCIATVKEFNLLRLGLNLYF